jgi:hypothetical protein
MIDAVFCFFAWNETASAKTATAWPEASATASSVW